MTASTIGKLQEYSSISKKTRKQILSKALERDEKRRHNEKAVSGDATNPPINNRWGSGK